MGITTVRHTDIMTDRHSTFPQQTHTEFVPCHWSCLAKTQKKGKKRRCKNYGGTAFFSPVGFSTKSIPLLHLTTLSDLYLNKAQISISSFVSLITGT